MGQTKAVRVHKFLVSGTIEERVYQLQEQKLELAKGVLDGYVSTVGAHQQNRISLSAELKRINKLTLNDLKFLFDIDQSREVVKKALTTAGTVTKDQYGQSVLRLCSDRYSRRQCSRRR